jgi:hypothetical protein
MGTPLGAPNGDKPTRVKLPKDPDHAGLLSRVASWLVNVATPKLIPDHLTVPLAERAPNADARPERTARRLMRHEVDRRGPTNPDGHTR